MTLSQVFKSRLLSNIWNQFLLYGFSSIIPILLIPYLLNVIGVEKYGLVNFAIIFSFYFQIFNEFGFDLLMSGMSSIIETIKKNWEG